MADSNIKEESGFHLKKVHNLKEIAGTGQSFIPESDLSIQADEFLLQYDYKKAETQKSIIIKPGSYNLEKGMAGIDVVPMEFVNKELLTSIMNTSKILNEASTFFNNLHVYDELGQPKKRGVLLYGPPGHGKTQAIIQTAKDLKKTDTGTVVINWPTSELEAHQVFKFFTSYSEYDSSCTKLILIIEDIGGSSHEGYSRRDEVSSSLLNLLDGVNSVFKLPTLILATTNHPENLMASLAQRPGRFDMLLEIDAPSELERIELLEFISKRTLSDNEKNSLNSKINPGVENFSIAHLQEIAVRSKLHEKPIDVVIKELVQYVKKFKLDFAKPKPRTGFNFDD